MNMKNLEIPDMETSAWGSFVNSVASDMEEISRVSESAYNSAVEALALVVRIKEKAGEEPTSFALERFLEEIDATIESLRNSIPTLEVATWGKEAPRNLTVFEKMTREELRGVLAQALRGQMANLNEWADTENGSSELNPATLNELEATIDFLEDLASEVEMDSRTVWGSEGAFLDKEWDKMLDAMRDVVKSKDTAQMNDLRMNMGDITKWLEAAK